MCTTRLLPVPPRCVPAQGMYLPGGCTYPGSVPAQGCTCPGCTCPAGVPAQLVYLPREGVYLPREGCTCPEGCICPEGGTCLGGVHDQGVYLLRDVPAQRVYLPGSVPSWGVYLPRGCTCPWWCTCPGRRCTCRGVCLPRYSPPVNRILDTRYWKYYPAPTSLREVIISLCLYCFTVRRISNFKFKSAFRMNLNNWQK